MATDSFEVCSVLLNCRGVHYGHVCQVWGMVREELLNFFSFGHLKHKYSPVSCHGCLLFLIYLFGFTKTVLPYEEYYGIGFFFLSVYCIP